MKQITLPDLNQEDRLFVVDDLIVKVKTLHDDEHSTLGQEIYRLSGSICDAKGKALPGCVYNNRHVATLQSSEATTSLIDALMPSTEMVVTETIQAYRNYQSRTSGVGVGSLSEFKARSQRSTGQ
jgi:hypothetical protein